MKKMDEMDRSIQLRAEELAYKVVLGALAGSTCANWANAVLYKMPPDLVPGLILCLAVCVQGISQILFKQEMVRGDEESPEPNRAAQVLGAAAALGAFVLAAGVLLLWV